MTRVAPVSCTGSASKKCMKGRRGIREVFWESSVARSVGASFVLFLLYEVVLSGEMSLLWGNLGRVRESIDQYVHSYPERYFAQCCLDV